MNHKSYKALLPVLALIFFWGCESYSQDDYRELIVTESYLIAGRLLPEIRVSRTLPLDQRYTFEAAALNSALVRVHLLDDGGSTEEVFIYSISERNGIYTNEDNHTVLPRRSYRLEIEFTNRDEVLEAVTTVPDQVQVINEVQESVVYQSDDQLEIVLAPTQQTQKQNVFVFDSIAENPTEENLTPFYRAAVIDGDSGVDDFRNNSSGLINEGNFNVLPDGSISLFFPWIGAAFYGETQVVTNSVDQNLSDLIRSQEVQLGGSTLSPGEIPNLTYNVEGGIGVFGSISSDTVRTNFLRP
jgi:hypothetical protein